MLPKKPKPEPLMPAHGGYRALKSFQLGQLIYDLTVRFCNLYIPPRSRTHDQMVQAARSGVQNIAEGSQASGTSKKMELKLTNVARASLEELRLDYEDFLRQRGFPKWPPNHPALRRFKAKRCASLEDLRGWIKEERQLSKNMDNHGQPRTSSAASVPVSESPCQSVPSSVLAANALLSLLNLCCYLLDRQLAAQAAAFEREGGFTERLHRIRTARRQAW
jgi:four helix bundle suffix protein